MMRNIDKLLQNPEMKEILLNSSSDLSCKLYEYTIISYSVSNKPEDMHHSHIFYLLASLTFISILLVS